MFRLAWGDVNCQRICVRIRLRAVVQASTSLASVTMSGLRRSTSPAETVHDFLHD